MNRPDSGAFLAGSAPRPVRSGSRPAELGEKEPRKSMFERNRD